METLEHKIEMQIDGYRRMLDYGSDGEELSDTQIISNELVSKFIYDLEELLDSLRQTIL
jgi:hypothetical protein